MFIEIEKAKFSHDFSVYSAKELGISTKEFLHYSTIFKTAEKGVYGAFLEDPLNPLKFQIVDENNTRLEIKLPKSVMKREKRKLSKIGQIKNSTTLVITNYGLADDEHQIKKEFSFLDRSREKYVIIVKPIHRENEPSSGGFRYHRHGRYIGRQLLKNEYLYDDTHVDYIMKFSILQIENIETKCFGSQKYQLINQYIFDKNQEIVALLYSFQRKICVGYIGSEKYFDIPTDINIKNEEELLVFINTLDL